VRHKLSQQDTLERAKQQLIAGEIPCLITSLQAKRMELHFIYRFDRKVQSIAKLQNPVTGHWFTGLRWNELRHCENQEAELMSLLRVSLSDQGVLTNMPVNQRVWYSISEPGVNKPGNPLILEARVVNRLQEYARKGFDTQPLGLTHLVSLLNEYLHIGERSNATLIVGLASPTGWEPQAIDFVSSNAYIKHTFSHPLIMPCLIDLLHMSIAYNEDDQRLKSLISIFRPLMREEEVRLAIEDIRHVVALSPGSVSLRQLREELPQYGEEVILRAAKELEAKGTHILQEFENVGLVISEHR